MKRAANYEGGHPQKKPRTGSPDPADSFNPALERKVTDLFENGTDGTGFFSATAFMTWPIKQKARLNVETFADKKLYRFDIELSGKCVPHFDKLKFCSRDLFQIALKGAKIEKTKSSSSPYSLAMTVRYAEGVIVKFITKSTDPTMNGQIVDTWKVQENEMQTGLEDDWFATPTKASSDLPKHTPDFTIVPQENPQPEPILTKKQAKKLRKRARQAAAAAAAAAAGISGSTSGSTPESISIPAKTPVNVEPNSEPIKETPQQIDAPVPSPVQESDLAPAPPQTITQTPADTQLPNSEPLDPALRLRAVVFQNEDRDAYVPINELQHGKFYNLIGVVTSVSQALKTSTNEWFRTMTIVDPSVCDVSDRYMGSPIKLTCFTPKYEEWLPPPRAGDILILRQVKADLYRNGMSAIGMNNRLRWAVFDPETGKVRHRDTGKAPESEGLADGYGYQFNPFWRPKESELAYCLRIGDWWRAVQKVREKDMGIVHHIGADIGTMARRQHRLIADASPHIPPNGFFDCTVEVLYGHMNDNNVYSLYVTDYTANSQMVPIQASWCPPELADRVLKIELWLAATELGPTMLRGEYYSIRNNRLKVSQGGFVEGTFSEVEKLQKLHESDDRPHLQALLQRKAEWQSANRSSVGKSSSFKHRLIQEVEVDVFFNCTVEVLHVVNDSNKPSCLYITDYTAHPDLLSKWNGESWSAGFDGRIVKVSLWDSQIELAKNVEAGAFYSILNLRLKKSLTGNAFQGRLGGDERLIHKLKAVDTTNEELKALIARKEKWKKENVPVECVDIGRKPQITRESDKASGELTERTVCTASSLLKPHSTIQEVLTSDKCPNQFCVVARVVDYYPLRLDECVVQQCTKCQVDIPAKYKACLACNDDEHEFVKYRYRLFLRLEDEEGTQIHVSACNEKCSLLEGLKPVNFQDNPDTRQKFVERLGPLIGNLVEVHDGRLQGVRIAPDTATLRYTIESWEISGDSDQPTKAYGFVNHEIA